MLRFLIAVPLIMHGLAHLGGFLASWTPNRAGFADRSWILSNGVTLDTTLARALSFVWLLALFGLVTAGLGIIWYLAWWPTMAVAAAGVSLFLIVLWCPTVPLGARVGAAFDLLILIALMLWREQIIGLF